MWYPYSMHCNFCNKDLPDNCFTVNKARKSGLSNKCRACTKEYDRIRNRLPERIKLRRVYKKRHQLKNPQKYQARRIVSRLIYKGRLKRGKCIYCDKIGEAHHSDYSKPLDITWLCRQHHLDHHYPT